MGRDREGKIYNTDMEKEWRRLGEKEIGTEREKERNI